MTPLNLLTCLKLPPSISSLSENDHPSISSLSKNGPPQSPHFPKITPLNLLTFQKWPPSISSLVQNDSPQSPQLSKIIFANVPKSPSNPPQICQKYPGIASYRAARLVANKRYWQNCQDNLMLRQGLWLKWPLSIVDGQYGGRHTTHDTLDTA